MDTKTHASGLCGQNRTKQQDLPILWERETRGIKENTRHSFYSENVFQKEMLFGATGIFFKCSVCGLNKTEKVGFKKSCELPVVFSVVQLVSLRHGSPLRAMTTHKRGVYTGDPCQQGGEGEERELLSLFPLLGPLPRELKKGGDTGEGEKGRSFRAGKIEVGRETQCKMKKSEK